MSDIYTRSARARSADLEKVVRRALRAEAKSAASDEENARLAGLVCALRRSAEHEADRCRELASELEKTQGVASHLKEEVATLKTSVEHEAGRCKKLTVDLEKTRGVVSHLREEVDKVQCSLDAIMRSTSWRITGPIRSVVAAGRRIRKHL